MPGAPRPDYVSTKRQRIAELAKNCPEINHGHLREFLKRRVRDGVILRQGTAPEARAKAARPLRVLRDHWQLLQPPGISGGSAKDLAAQAVSATPRR